MNSVLPRPLFPSSFQRKRLYEKTANRIAYYQRRNACARTSHTKARIRKLHRRGIKLTGLPRCEENTS